MFVYIVISLFPYRICITKLQKLHKTTSTGNRNVGDRLQISLSLLFAVDVCIEPFCHLVVRFHAADSQQLGRIRSNNVYTFVSGHWRTVSPCAWLKIGCASGYTVKDWGERKCRLLKNYETLYDLRRTCYLTQHQAAVGFPQTWPKDKGAAKIRPKKSPHWDWDNCRTCRKQSCLGRIPALIEDRPKPSTDMTTSAIKSLINRGRWQPTLPWFCQSEIPQGENSPPWEHERTWVDTFFALARFGFDAQVLL